MVVISEKSHAEHYSDRLVQSSSSDKTAGTPCIICPSSMIRDAIEYHDMGFMAKLDYKITTWLRKYAN